MKRLLPKSEFGRNVVTLMTGATIAQAIPIAISPILTRIYTPDDFGLFALYISIASIISAVATGRYELAIMLPQKDHDAINIAILSITISFSISVFTLILIIIANSQITRLLGNPEISTWLYFIPLSVILTGFFQTLTYWNNRNKNYRNLAINKVIQSTTTSAINLSLGINIHNASGLIIGSIVGQLSSVLNLGYKFINKKSEYLATASTEKILFLSKKYIKFPLYNLPNALIDSLRVSGIDILITKFFSAALLGQFYLAFRMLQAPMSLIGSSISQVFIQKISIAPRNEIKSIVKNFLLRSAIFMLPIFLLIYLFSVEIFIFFFGEKWHLSGEIASILTPWVYFNFLSSPISNVLIILDKQEIMLVFSFFYMIIPLAIIIFLHKYGFLFVLTTISTLMSIMLALFIILAYNFAKKEET